MISPDEWRPADGMIPEPNSWKAITETAGNVVIAAGPGSGKTELLAQRADFLLRTGICPYPRRILAISFKTDAARNLKERVRQRCGDDLAARLDSQTFHAFANQLVHNYRPMLTAANSLVADYAIHSKHRIPHTQITFDDLVPLGVEILQRSDHARLGLRQTYSHVFLDEFQDATDDQYEFVKEAFLDCDAQLCAVGDVKQRIMAWAGALDGVLDEFAGDFSASRLTLYQNYRSAPALRRMQNRMVQVMEPAAALPASDIPGAEGNVWWRHFADDSSEAEAVADLVDGWLAKGAPHREIAVLVRQQPHLIAAPVAAALTARGIASRDEASLQELTAEPAAALILDLLRVLSGERQAEAYQRLLRMSARTGVGGETAHRFASAVKRYLSTTRAQMRRTGIDRASFDDWLAATSQFLDLLTTPSLLALSESYQHGSRLQDVIKETLTRLRSAMMVEGDIRRALDRLSETDAIRILTMHKSKGLEFDRVIVLGVETELFWARNDDEENEARATFFVAISRAKSELVLTSTDRRPRPLGFSGRWDTSRHPHKEFLGYVDEPGS